MPSSTPFKSPPTLFFATILLLSLLLCTHIGAQHQIQQTSAKGKCVPLQQFALDTVLTGFSQITCSDILRSSNVTHHWVTVDQISDGNIDGPCAGEGQWVADSEARFLATTLSETTPICQQVLGLAACLANFKPCDPLQDTPEAGYVTEETAKPCKWLCDAVYNSDKDICSADDRALLNTYHINLDDPSKAVLPYLDCANTNYWSADEDKCVTSGSIPQTTVVTQCVLYTGTFCASVFNSNTYVSVPGGTTIEEMESRHDLLGAALMATPFRDPTCGATLTRVSCGLLFPECLDLSLPVVEENPSNVVPGSDTKLKVTMELRLPQEACEDYLTACVPTAFYKTTWVAAALELPVCSYFPKLRQNACYPKGLTPDMGIDYVPPTTFEMQGVGTNSTTELSLFSPQTQQDKQFQSIALNNNFSIQQDQAQPKYSVAQINLINRVNEAYDFNSLMYLARYASLEKTFNGPRTSNGVHVTTQLWAGSTFNVQTSELPYPDSCPSELVIPQKYYDKNETNWGNLNLFGGRCAVQCPSPAYSESDRRRIEIAAFFFVFAALIFSGILSLTFIVFRSQRHKWILSNYTFSYFLMTVFMAQGLLYRKHPHSAYDFQCDSNTTLAHFTGFGLYQSIGLIFFLLASSAWWMIIALDLYERLILSRVYLRSSPSYYRRRYIMHAYAWGSAFICTLGFIVGEQLGYDGALPFAFAALSPTAVSDPLNLSWFFLFLPLLAYTIFGVISVGIVVYSLARRRSSEGLKQYSDQFTEKRSFTEKIKNGLKLFGFLLCMVIFFILLIWHEVNVGSNTTQWRDDLQAWGEFKLFSETPPPLASRLEPGLIILVVFGLSSPGIAMFLIYFVFQPEVLGLWSGLFFYKMGCGCCEKYAREDTKSGTGSGHSGSGHSSGGSTHSTDIFGSAEGVTNTKRTQHESIATGTVVFSGLEKSPSQGHIGKDQKDHHGLNLGASSPRQESVLVSKSHHDTSIKRKTLFKGMSVEPVSKSKASSSNSKSTTNHNIVRTNSVEMGLGMIEIVEERSQEDEEEE